MIELRGISKSYGSGRDRVSAIGSVDLTIGRGEFVSIVGPSGCGKSTILNMIAGFLPPTTGQIRVGGQPVVEGVVPAGLGYIFQKDTVLPWLYRRRGTSGSACATAAARPPRSTPRCAICSAWRVSPATASSTRTSSRAACASASRS